MDTESWVVTEPQVVEVEDVRSLRVAVVGGRVDVVGREEPGARVEIHSVAGRPVEVALVGGELSIGYAVSLSGWEGLLEKFRGATTNDLVEVHIAVHREAAVKIGAVTADALVADVVQVADVSTVSGSVVTSGTYGALRAKTVAGDVSVSGHTGSLSAKTVSGAITASGAFSQVSAATVAGAVTLDAAQAAEVTVRSVSGSATLRVPAGLGLRVSGRSASGRVVVDGQDRRVAGSTGGAVDVTTGDGACAVQVQSVSGHLTVLRAPSVWGE